MSFFFLVRPAPMAEVEENNVNKTLEVFHQKVEPPFGQGLLSRHKLRPPDGSKYPDIPILLTKRETHACYSSGTQSSRDGIARPRGGEKRKEKRKSNPEDALM